MSKKKHISTEGDLAISVAKELSFSMREMRERLARMVEDLDRHTMASAGPGAFPWEEVERFRYELSELYLISRKLTRKMDDLGDVYDSRFDKVQTFNLNKTVDSAYQLCRHFIAEKTIVCLDFGTIPLLHSVRGAILLGVSQMIVNSAYSTETVEGATIGISTSVIDSTESSVSFVEVKVRESGNGGYPDDVVSRIGDLFAELGGLFSHCLDTAADGSQWNVQSLRLPINN